MLSYAVALAAALTVVPPDPSTEAPIVVSPPPPGPSLGVVVVSNAPSEPVRPSPILTPLVPREPNSGAALWGAASVVFAVGLGSQIVSSVAQSNYCARWDDRGFNGVHGCFYATEPWTKHQGTGVAFGSALVMSNIGAAALGRYHAWHAAFGDRRPRHPYSRVVTGVGLVSLSLVTFLAEGLLLRRELHDPCATFECEVERRALYYGLADAGSLSLIAGTSMIAYGRSYTKHRTRYRVQWSLTPQTSPSLLGASASLRF